MVKNGILEISHPPYVNLLTIIQRVPFGFYNSLARFIRTLQLVLGSDSTAYGLNCVDDIIVYYKTYGEHVKYLDVVLGN
jgi:hypothetical protein